MKEVIAEIRQLEKVLEGKIQVTQDKIQMVHDKLSNEIKIVYWVVAIAMSIILFAGGEEVISLILHLVN